MKKYVLLSLLFLKLAQCQKKKCETFASPDTPELTNRCDGIYCDADSQC